MSAAAAAFFVRLDARLGERSIAGLEAEAHLGKSTLANARKRGNVPGLAVVLAICRVLGGAPADLLGDDTPPELVVSDHPAGSATRDIPFLSLTGSDLNPRQAFDAHLIDELAASIQAQGLLQNLVVRPGRPGGLFTVVAGSRRFRALEQLVRDHRLPDSLAGGIPCRVVDTTDAEHVVLALLENMQRVDVNPMDEAEALARLHELDPVAWSTRIIAERLGVTQRHVQLRLALATKLIPTAKQGLRDGTLTLSMARLLATQPFDRQEEALEDFDGHIYDPVEDLASFFRHDMMRVEHALFDVAASGLELLETSEGGFIIDPAAATRLQRAAIAQLVREHTEAGAAFVEVVDYMHNRHYAHGGTGVVIETKNCRGRVRVHIDLRRAGQTEAASGDPDREGAEPASAEPTGEPPESIPSIQPKHPWAGGPSAGEHYFAEWYAARLKLLAAVNDYPTPSTPGEPLPAAWIHMAQAVGHRPDPILHDDAAARLSRMAGYAPVAEAAA